MQLSMTRGTPIARVEGGRDDGKVIRLYDPEKKCCDKCTKKCLTKKRRCCKKCEVKVGGCGTCGGSARGGALELETMMMRAKGLEGQMKALQDFLSQQFQDPDMAQYKVPAGGKLVPIPMTDTRQIDYVSAPSGAGKSTYAAKLAKEYKKEHPKNPVIVLSRLEEDPSLDLMGEYKRIPITEELLEDPLDPAKDFKDCLVILDDIDTIREPALRKEMQRVREDIMEIGRHPSTNCISTSHMLMNYGATRGLINEAHKVTLFPGYTPVHHINRYLKIYGGFQDDEIRAIRNLPSRWVTLNQKGARYLMHEGGIMLLSKMDLPKAAKDKKEKKVRFKDIDEQSTDEIEDQEDDG